jgi:hypothetical protein
MSLLSLLSVRDRRALTILVAGLAVSAVLHYAFPTGSGGTIAPAAGVHQDNIGLAQQRLTRLRQIAATVPAREAVLKQTVADLADRERGMIQADTAAQAQATLLETARRIGKNEQIDVRGGDLGAPKPFGEYGLVYATVSFECHVEQLVNFLADLSREPALIVPSEERITSGNPKEKTLGVRMVLAGVVARKLVPDKKGLATF